jgi:flagellar assembly factor FliW
MNAEQQIVRFSTGLPGFETCRSFVLFSAEAAPFQWLSAVDGAAASFLVVDPRRIVADFQHRVSGPELERLGAASDAGLLWLAIVLIETDGSITVNVGAPIVINPAAMTGMQLLPQDGLQPLRHVLVPAAAA